ncbi:hypothetical protein HMPREF1577_01014 [Gardnerella pickettii JCP8017A]|uniref:Uncharacterized protein n=1 Tax=Gardnerella pickettii JCP8017A TaxID=1261062 RepID=T2PJQ6_9BIFI|nr:hypothetical protein HMPREF1577_01014 [Gardnerella pickettii JCP8017A]EPI60103.1 hypothetical protein HMPREF1578_01184 [Gardnerella pickettii JCP8017B]
MGTYHKPLIIYPPPYENIKCDSRDNLPFRLKRSAKRQIGAQAIIAGIIRVQVKHECIDV